MIPTYNPTEHLRETLLAAREAIAALAGRVQLEIVDDASPAVDVKEMLRTWGLGPVPVHRRSVNGGLGACWNTCVERARGELVHILHQDDLVRPTFYERMGQLAVREPAAGMLFCRTEFLDEHGSRLAEIEPDGEGRLDDWLTRISAGQRIQCPTVVVRRETYRRLGFFEPSLRYVIDWEMWVRIAASSEVAYLPEPLAVYRVHSSAETQRVKADGFVTRDLARGLKFVRATLASADRLDCLAAAKRFAVHFSMDSAEEAESAGDLRAAAKEVGASLRYLSGAMGMRRWLRQVRRYIALRVSSATRSRGASGAVPS
jgi:Glycosyl transferase family 2